MDMKKDLVWWEIKKLWQLRMWIVFLVLSMAFNFLLIAEGGAFSEEGAYAAYVGEVTQTAGNRMGDDFTAQALTLPEHFYRERLLSETAGAAEILSGYKTQELYAYYMEHFHLDGFVADALAKKYEELQERVDILAAQQASLAVGAAGATQEVLENLFYWLCPALLIESVLLAVLLALYAGGGEQMSRTQYLVYTTRRGRKIQMEKAVAALVSAEAAYLLLAGSSFGIFAVCWRLGAVWRMDMSSQFYSVRDMGVEMPFISWMNFTLKGYLCAVMGMGVLMILLFGLFGLCAGLVTKNAYRGFLLLLICGTFNFWGIFVSENSGLWSLYEIMQWTPAGIWSNVSFWLSGLGMSVLVPWQEVLAALTCLLIAGGLFAAARVYFERREIY